MKRSVKMLILLIVLVLAAGGYILAQKTAANQTAQVTETETKTALTTHTQEEIASIAWTAEDGELKFVKTDGTWQYAADKDYPVDGDALETLASKAAGLSADRKLENVKELSVYGLSEPVFTLTVGWSDGTEESFSMGDETAFGDSYYLKKSNDDAVYTVSTSLKSTFQKTLLSLAVMEEMPTVASPVRLTVGGFDMQYEAISRVINTGVHWYSGEIALNSTSAQSLVGSAQSLAWNEIISGNASDSELSGYGLGEGCTTLQLWNEGDETPTLSLKIGTTDATGNSYACLENSRTVYTIEADLLSDLLAADAETLRANDLLTLAIEDVQTASITAAGKTVTLPAVVTAEATETAETAEAAETTEATEAAETTEEEEEPERFTDGEKTLWTLVTSLTSKGDAQEKDGEIVLTVEVTNVNGVSAVLTLREYDASSYQAQLDSNSPVLVSATSVENLIRQVKYFEN